MSATVKKQLRDVYLGGVILPAGPPSDPTDAADPTFRFTDYERRNLDLKGVPIVAEHSKRDRDVVVHNSSDSSSMSANSSSDL